MRKLFALLLLAPFLSIVTSCDEKDDPTIALKTTEASLNKGETYQIEALSDGIITYVSENNFHANVSSDGLVTAQYVGETNILLNDGKETQKFKVTVAPKHTLINTPYLEWGTSQSTIVNKFGTEYIYNDSLNIIDYYGINTSAVYFTRFIFNDDDQLTGTAIYIDESDFTETGRALQERYKYGGTQEDENTNIVHVFFDALNEDDATMMVYTIQITEHGLVAILYNPLERSTIESPKSTLSRSSVKLINKAYHLPHLLLRGF